MISSSLLRKQRIILAVLLVLIAATAVLSAGMGYSSLSYGRLLPTLMGEGTFKEEFVLFSVRLPRIVITLLAGMALAVSGSILQGITRNPLSDPGMLGINAGAGVAVTVCFLFFPVDAGAFAYLLPLAAFAGALITAALIYLFAYSRNEGLQPMKLTLIGVGFSIALSGMMIVLISAVDYWKVDFIAKWLAGNIWGTDWPFIWAVSPWLAVLIPFALVKAKRLNLLELGDPVATGIGVSVERERIVLLLTAVALAAAAVSVSGSIAFVGLMAPHIARALIGPRHQLFMPVAILTGGFLLLLADTAGRNLTDPDGIPAGIMVALIGAPYFIALLFRK
ncbi:FecCD family ABC transporter permease [Gorillibacterium sp. sgz5001074]|uniref:FecCD family ABC transporter permease n=1 Tax=Gorillibacterium sp. sgz5001074 TaxID=3446695 RepID=UPI003F676548